MPSLSVRAILMVVVSASAAAITAFVSQDVWVSWQRLKQAEQVVEVTAATQSVAGTSGRPNFTVQTVSGDNNLTAGTSGTVSGWRIGNGDSTETHTHTMSSQVAGAQLLVTGFDANEQMTLIVDGVTLNLTIFDRPEAMIVSSSASSPSTWRL